MSNNNNNYLQIICFTTIKKTGYYHKNEIVFLKDMDFDIEGNKNTKRTKLVANPDKIGDEN